MCSIYYAGHILSIDLVLTQLYKITYGDYRDSTFERTHSSRQMCVLFVLYWEHALLPIPLFIVVTRVRFILLLLS